MFFYPTVLADLKDAVSLSAFTIYSVPIELFTSLYFPPPPFFAEFPPGRDPTESPLLDQKPFLTRRCFFRCKAILAKSPTLITDPSTDATHEALRKNSLLLFVAALEYYF